MSLIDRKISLEQEKEIYEIMLKIERNPLKKKAIDLYLRRVNDELVDILR